MRPMGCFFMAACQLFWVPLVLWYCEFGDGRTSSLSTSAIWKQAEETHQGTTGRKTGQSIQVHNQSSSPATSAQRTSRKSQSRFIGSRLLTQCVYATRWSSVLLPFQNVHCWSVSKKMQSLFWFWMNVWMRGALCTELIKLITCKVQEEI